jgi:hypothetical protein
MRKPEEIAADIIRRMDVAITNRGTLESHLEEIALRVLPNYAGSFTSNGLPRTAGDKRTDEMVDATAALALTRFAAAMESMLTPRNSRWHSLVPTDKTLMKNRAVRLWFEDLTDKLFHYRYAPKANFASQKHEDYMALGAFGTGCIFIDGLQDRSSRPRGLRYSAIHLGEIYFLENHQGIIDTAMRKFSFTARQAVQKFSMDMLPESIVEASKNSTKTEKTYEFIHCVRPREEEDGYDPDRKDMRGMSYGSYYVSIEGKKLVKEGGYFTLPYSISRYVIAPGETYGRSPAMLALPAIKVLNEEKRTVLKQGHRSVDPVLLTHDDGVIDGFSLHPGALNPGGVSAEGRPLVHALPVGNLALAQEMMQDERATINDFFLVTLFQILVENPRMTATEVIERAREKGALLSPTMGRQQSEALGPQIEREVDILMSQGLIDPMPPALREAQGEFTITYDSPLSRMAKAEAVSGLFRTVDWIREYVAVTQDPSPLDWIDWDTAMPAVLDSQAVSASWQRSAEAVKKLREQRVQAAQTQQIIDAAPAAASVIKSGQMAGKGV